MTLYQPVITRDLPEHLKGDIDRKTHILKLKDTKEEALELAEKRLQKELYPGKAQAIPVQYHREAARKGQIVDLEA
jgi:hypothetical protein